MGGWSTNLSAGFISYPVQPTGLFVGQTYYNSTTDTAYVFDGTTWVALTGTMGGLNYLGTWNANTNTPTLGNGGAGGVNGDYYVVSVAGTTSIDGVNDWGIGDWIINNGTTWQKIDNSELPTIYTGNGTVGTNRVLTLTDSIRTDSVIGAMTTQYGIGLDPLGFGYSGALSYMYATPTVAVEAWGGVLNLSGTPSWWHEVYNPAGDTSGTFIGYSIAQTNPYSSLYHFESAGGTYRGFEANRFGEQLYSQRLALVTTPLTSADRVLFVSNAGGYIRATTYADLVTQLAIPTLYSANGTISAARVVTITGTLNFLTTTNGVAIGSAFTTNNALEVRAFSATRSTVIQGFNTTTNSALVIRNSTTNLADFQNVGNIVFANASATHRVNIGGSAGTARLTVQGSGATSATIATRIQNSATTLIASFADDSSITLNGRTSVGLGRVPSATVTLVVGETRTTAGTFVINQNSVLVNPALAGIYVMTSAQDLSTIQGTLYSAGSIVTGTQSAVAGSRVSGSANLVAIASDVVIFKTAGSTLTLSEAYGIRVKVGTDLLGAGTVTATSMYGIRMNNGDAGISSTNNYGLFIEDLTRGTNNYGIVSLTARNGFGTITPDTSSILDLTSTVKGFLAPRMTLAQKNAIVTPATGLLIYQTDAPAGFYYFNGAVWVYLITPVTLYLGDGTITDVVRTVTMTGVGNALQFNHGAAGVNGFFQIANNGYVLNQTSTVGNYFEYNGNNGDFSVRSQTHTTTGFRAFRLGTAGNPTAELNLKAGSNGNCYLDIAPTVPIFFFHTNNTATIAGTIYGSNGAWGIGGFAETSSSLLVTGKGNTVATNTQRWRNLGGTDLARMTDNGVLCIGTTTPSSYLGTAQKMHIDSTVSSDYSPSVIVNQVYSPTVNNSNSSSSAVFAMYKANAFNTLEMRGIVSIARNDGTGAFNFLYGMESFVYNIGASTINSAFAYSARCQIRDGVVTNWGGLDISYQENGAPALVTNMIGVFVRTPTNVLGITVTNTYGMLIQGNAIGTNNYAYTSDGRATSGLGTITPNQQAMLHIRANHDPVFKAHVYFEPITAAQASTIVPSNGMGVYVSDTNGTFTSTGFWKYENGAWATW